MSLQSLLSSAAGAALQRVTVESSVTPPIVIDRPLGDGGGGGAPAGDGGGGGGFDPGALLLRALAPRITVEVAGWSPLVIQPAGAPLGLWPLVAAGAGVTVLLAMYGAWRLARG
jgi:hypothetical protein